MLNTKYYNYAETLRNDVEDFVHNCFDEFLDDIKSSGIQEFNDVSRRMDEWITGVLSLREAVDILENCYNEETNSDFWRDLSPKEAIVSMAYWSYRNDFIEAVRYTFDDRINSEIDEQEEKLNDLESKLNYFEDKDSNEEIENRKDELSDKIDELSNYVHALRNTQSNI